MSAVYAVFRDNHQSVDNDVVYVSTSFSNALTEALKLREMDASFGMNLKEDMRWEILKLPINDFLDERGPVFPCPCSSCSPATCLGRCAEIAGSCEDYPKLDNLFALVAEYHTTNLQGKQDLCKTPIYFTTDMLATRQLIYNDKEWVEWLLNVYHLRFGRGLPKNVTFQFYRVPQDKFLRSGVSGCTMLQDKLNKCACERLQTANTLTN